MKKMICLVLPFIIYSVSWGQLTPYEVKGKNYSATYEECIDYYYELEKEYKGIKVMEMGNTDANKPLHLILLSSNGKFKPSTWHQQNKVVILINNGIHPGEPDGIDASMLFCRTILQQIQQGNFSDNVTLAIIPIYNIGGMLNRSAYYRVDQEGPDEFGSRGNSQNLDLNRDFIKCDSREAKSFAEIFHFVNPDIFIDNHVSDGADYPNVMTLASSQKDKLGGNLGKYLHTSMEPSLYQMMKDRGYPMIPYVNVWGKDVREGWSQFFDSPRYSSGYATLFGALAFVPETHMLKPYQDRVDATHKLMQCILDYSEQHHAEIKQQRARNAQSILDQSELFINWKVKKDSFEYIVYNGYLYDDTISSVSQLPIKFYNKLKPYKEAIKFYNYYEGSTKITVPDYYLIPQGWYKVIELLHLNKVTMYPLVTDTSLQVEAYTILSCKSSDAPYEGHHGNSNVVVQSKQLPIHFRSGDWLIPTNQVAKRFLVETLEPEAMDSYFCWNYFDAILNQKEGFTSYAYEAKAGEYLRNNSWLRDSLKKVCEQDSSLATSALAQLDFVYKHSPYYEPQHNRYPVYRLFKNTQESENKMESWIDTLNANKADE